MAGLDQPHHAEDCASGLLLERRWFAARRAAMEVQTECDALADVLDMANAAWRDARARLVQLEALRDALGEQLVSDDRLEIEGAIPFLQKSAA